VVLMVLVELVVLVEIELLTSGAPRDLPPTGGPWFGLMT
jgi:hypothetical protein